MPNKAVLTHPLEEQYARYEMVSGKEINKYGVLGINSDDINQSHNNGSSVPAKAACSSLSLATQED